MVRRINKAARQAARRGDATAHTWLVRGQFGFAEDINNAGIVVGYNAAPVTLELTAFLRLTNGIVIELAPAQGDIESEAFAVSNVVTVLDDSVVYVAGRTTDAGFVQRGVRWTVNVDTGAVVALTVLNMEFGNSYLGGAQGYWLGWSGT